VLAQLSMLMLLWPDPVRHRRNVNLWLQAWHAMQAARLLVLWRHMIPCSRSCLTTYRALMAVAASLGRSTVFHWLH